MSGLLWIIVLVLVILKVLGVLPISWFLVFLPILVPMLVIVMTYLAAAIINKNIR